MARKAKPNTSIWIKEAERKGLDLSFLHREELKPFSATDELGLPRPEFYIISAKEIDSPKTRKIFNRTNCFCRLIPKQGGLRPYRLNLKSVEELEDFCS